MGDIVGFQDEQIWLSSRVPQDPLFDHSRISFKNHGHHKVSHGRGGFHRPAAPPLMENIHLNNNARNNWQRSKGEERMQAFFLVTPGHTTSGTGVFLPTTSVSQSPTKPAYAPVLLPARVVQALNLNVQNLGLHISPRPDIREIDLKKKSEIMVSAVNTRVETPIDSPEKLLPEEWTY